MFWYLIVPVTNQFVLVHFDVLAQIDCNEKVIINIITSKTIIFKIIFKLF